MRKRLLAIMLTLCMILSMFSGTAFAAEGQAEPAPSAVEVSGTEEGAEPAAAEPAPQEDAGTDPEAAEEPAAETDAPAPAEEPQAQPETPARGPGGGNSGAEASLSLKYDDRFTPEADWGAYQSVQNQTVTSFQVSTQTPDTDVVVYAEGQLIAVGVGTADVQFENCLVHVTVEAAPISLVMMIGHSLGSGSQGDAGGSIVCEAGTVYSSHEARNPGTDVLLSNVADVTGLGLGYGSARRPAKIDALTEPGDGANGGDSGIGYGWYQATGEKIWVLNTAVGSSHINWWLKGDTEKGYYDRAATLFQKAEQVLDNEMAAGHYILRHMGMINYNAGNQGYLYNMQNYTEKLDSLWSDFRTDLTYEFSDGETRTVETMGFLSLWNYSSMNNMSSPFANPYNFDVRRLVSHLFAAQRPEFYVASDLERQWLTDADVAAYFAAHPLVYDAIQNGQTPVAPTTVAEVNKDGVHFQQVGYNVEGIDAAETMARHFGYVDDDTSFGLLLQDGKTAAPASFSLAAGASTVLVPMPAKGMRATVTVETTGAAVWDPVEGTLCADPHARENDTGTITFTVAGGGSVSADLTVTQDPADTVIALETMATLHDGETRNIVMDQVSGTYAMVDETTLKAAGARMVMAEPVSLSTGGNWAVEFTLRKPSGYYGPTENVADAAGLYLQFGGGGTNLTVTDPASGLCYMVPYADYKAAVLDQGIAASDWHTYRLACWAGTIYYYIDGVYVGALTKCRSDAANSAAQSDGQPAGTITLQYLGGADQLAFTGQMRHITITKDSRTLHFDLGGAAIDGTAPADETTFGGLISLLPDLGENTAGDAFLGWGLGDAVYNGTAVIPGAGNVTLTAQWGQLPAFAVSCSSQMAAISSLSGEDTVLKGKNFAFTVAPAEGYMVYPAGGLKVFANGTALTPDGEGVYTIENVTEDQVITLEGLVVSVTALENLATVKIGEGDTMPLPVSEVRKFDGGTPSYSVDSDGYVVGNSAIIQFADAITFPKDMPWSIEFTVKNPKGANMSLFSDDGVLNVQSVGDTEIYLKSDGDIFLLRESGNTSWKHYCIKTNPVPSGFDVTKAHTYKLERRTDGSIYVTVDGTQWGKMNYYMMGTTNRATTNAKGDEEPKFDFELSTIGAKFNTSDRSLQSNEAVKDVKFVTSRTADDLMTDVVTLYTPQGSRSIPLETTGIGTFSATADPVALTASAAQLMLQEEVALDIDTEDWAIETTIKNHGGALGYDKTVFCTTDSPVGDIQSLWFSGLNFEIMDRIYNSSNNSAKAFYYYMVPNATFTAATEGLSTSAYHTYRLECKNGNVSFYIDGAYIGDLTVYQSSYAANGTVAQVSARPTGVVQLKYFGAADAGRPGYRFNGSMQSFNISKAPRTLRFDVNGAGGVEEVPEQTAFVGIETTLPDPGPDDQEGRCIGWTLDPEGQGELYTGSVMLPGEGNLTLYAQWEYPEEYTVSCADDTVTVSGLTDGTATAPRNGSFSFTVTPSENGRIYPADGAITVYANGTELTPVEGTYTIENITRSQEITASGLTRVYHITTYAHGDKTESLPAVCVRSSTAEAASAYLDAEGYAAGTHAIFEYDQPMTFPQDKPWSIEFTYENTNAGSRAIFSDDGKVDGGQTNDTFLYIRSDGELYLVRMYTDGTSYRHYSAEKSISTVSSSFNVRQPHTYKLERQTDGNVYLTVDGVSLGALDGYGKATTDRSKKVSGTPDFDFTIGTVGGDRHQFSASLDWGIHGARIKDIVFHLPKNAEDVMEEIITYYDADGTSRTIPVTPTGVGTASLIDGRNRESALKLSAAALEMAEKVSMDIDNEDWAVEALMRDRTGESLLSNDTTVWLNTASGPDPDNALLFAGANLEIFSRPRKADGSLLDFHYYMVPKADYTEHVTNQGISASGWHTYRLECHDGTLTYYLDGSPVGELSGYIAGHTSYGSYTYVPNQLSGIVTMKYIGVMGVGETRSLFKFNGAIESLNISKDTRTITYDLNNVTGPEQPAPQTAFVGIETTFPTLDKNDEDGDFVGWTLDPEGTGTVYTDPALLEGTEDLTLYAQWEYPTEYTVHYDSDAVIIPELPGGSATVATRADFSFTLTPAENCEIYPDASALKVYANGEELTAVNGTYTITQVRRDQEITVEGVIPVYRFTTRAHGETRESLPVITVKKGLSSGAAPTASMTEGAVTGNNAVLGFSDTTTFPAAHPWSIEFTAQNPGKKSMAIFSDNGIVSSSETGDTFIYLKDDGNVFLIRYFTDGTSYRHYRATSGVPAGFDVTQSHTYKLDHRADGNIYVTVDGTELGTFDGFARDTTGAKTAGTPDFDFTIGTVGATFGSNPWAVNGQMIRDVVFTIPKNADDALADVVTHYTADGATNIPLQKTGTGSVAVADASTQEAYPAVKFTGAQVEMEHPVALDYSHDWAIEATAKSGSGVIGFDKTVFCTSDSPEGDIEYLYLGGTNFIIADRIYNNETHSQKAYYYYMVPYEQYRAKTLDVGLVGGDWHTYRLECRNGVVSSYIDGVYIGDVTVYQSSFVDNGTAWQNEGAPAGPLQIRYFGSSESGRGFNGTLERFLITEVSRTLHFAPGDAYGGETPADIPAFAGAGTLLPTLERNSDGQDFLGWTLDGSGAGTVYSDYARIPGDGDVTLYAKWGTLETYTVSCDNRAVVISGLTDGETQVAAGESFSFTVTPASGYLVYPEDALKVYVNGSLLRDNEGTYTILSVDEPQAITVEGVIHPISGIPQITTVKQGDEDPKVLPIVKALPSLRTSNVVARNSGGFLYGERAVFMYAEPVTFPAWNQWTIEFTVKNTGKKATAILDDDGSGDNSAASGAYLYLTSDGDLALVHWDGSSYLHYMTEQRMVPDGFNPAEEHTYKLSCSGSGNVFLEVDGTIWGQLDHYMSGTTVRSGTNMIAGKPNFTFKIGSIGADRSGWDDHSRDWGITNLYIKDVKFTLAANKGVAQVGDRRFESVAEAVEYANAGSNKLVYLIGNATVDADLTIPAGVTLLLPYAPGSNTINSASAKLPYANTASTSSSPAITPPGDYVNFKLTVKDGATLTVANGARLIVGGQFAGHLPVGGQTNGSHSEIELTEDSSIELQNGSITSCFGYITGGSVHAATGAKVYEPFVVTDFNGGSITAKLFDSYGMSPFLSYTVMNIRSELNVASGAELYGYCSLNASGGQNSTTSKLIGASGAMLNLTSGTLTGTYAETVGMPTNQTGRTRLVIDGNAEYKGMTMDVMGFDINLGDTDFPVPYNFDIEQKSGTLTVSEPVALLPGASVTVDEDAALELSSTLYVLEGYVPVTIASRKYPNLTAPANLASPTTGALRRGGFSERAHLIVDGTMHIADGAGFGGLVETRGTSGKLTVGSATLSKTFIHGVYEGDRYSGYAAPASTRGEYPLTARIQGVDGELQAITANSTYGAAGDTAKSLTEFQYYYYTQKTRSALTTVTYSAPETVTGTWAKELTLTFNPGDGDADEEIPPMKVLQGVAATLPACTYYLDGHTFAGWNTDPDGAGTAYADQAEITVSEDTELFAQWTPRTYTVEFTGTAGTKTLENVPYGSDVTIPADVQQLLDENAYSYSWSLKDPVPGFTLPAFSKTASFRMPDVEGGKLTIVITGTLKTFEIRFTADPVTGQTPEALTVTYGEAFYDRLPVLDVPAGYKGYAWQKDGVSVTAEDLFLYGEDITLTAFWSKLDYTPIWTWSGDAAAPTVTLLLIPDQGADVNVDAGDITLTKISETPATCETAGSVTYKATYTLVDTYTDGRAFTVPATGHSYGEPTYTWSEDNATVTATVTCGKDETHVVTETVNTTYQATAPTCETAGTGTYTATFTNSLFTTQTKDITLEALGHSFGAPTWTWSDDLRTATATFTCANDETHVETVDAAVTSEITQAATCEETGTETITATVTFNGKTYTSEKTAEVAAIGHAWGEVSYTWSEDNATVTATRICANNAEHKETETVNTTSAITTPATCEGKGVTTYTATFTNQAFQTQTKTEENVPALGHAYGTPTYTWSEDNATVTAKAICAHDQTHIVTETVNTTAEETTAATCEAPGVKTFTATFENDLFKAQSKEVTLPAIGHSWNEPTYTWSEDNTTVTATRICANNAEHKETETANTTSAITTPATCEADGVLTFTASFVSSSFATQTKTESIAKLGHKWNEGEITTPATCKTDGVKTFTCQNDPTHTYTEVIPATGHSYGQPVWSWNEDHTEATATFTCGNCTEETEDHVVVLTATSEEGITSETTEATHLIDGQTVYTATVTMNGETFTNTVTVVLTAEGHIYGEPEWSWNADFTEATATFVCKEGDDTQTVTTTEITSKELTGATCTAEGTMEYAATVTFKEATYSGTTTGPISKIAHNLTHHDPVPATCTATGLKEYWYCEACQQFFSDEGTTVVTYDALVTEKIPHSYEGPVWAWSGYESATATFTCSACNDAKVLNAVITDEVTTEPTASEPGVRTYTATVNFEGTEYTDTKTEDLPSTGYQVTFTNQVGDLTPATLSLSNGLYLGETTLQVSCTNACTVGYTTDGGESYTTLAATAVEGTENTYSFTFDVQSEMEVVIVLKGDVDGNGKLTSNDSSLINRHIVKTAAHKALTTYQLLIADVDGNSKITSNDSSLINRAIVKTAAHKALIW